MMKRGMGLAVMAAAAAAAGLSSGGRRGVDLVDRRKGPDEDVAKWREEARRWEDAKEAERRRYAVYGEAIMQAALDKRARKAAKRLARSK